MPGSPQSLGQVSPPASTDTLAHAVGSGKTAIVSGLTICHTNAGNVAIRIETRIAGAAFNVKQYRYYNLSIPPNDTFSAVIGWTLGPLDEIWVYAAATNVAFNFDGIEG